MKTKNYVLGMIISILMFFACCSNPKESAILKKTGREFHVNMSYTQITGNYGYLRIDTMITLKGNQTKEVEKKTDFGIDHDYVVEKDKFVDKYSTIPYSTTFVFFKSPKKFKTSDSLALSNSLVMKICQNSFIVGNSRYAIDQMFEFDPDVPTHFYVKWIGENLLGKPYTQIIDSFICFRAPAHWTTVIVSNGDNKVIAAIADPGSFYNFNTQKTVLGHEKVDNDTYNYYFYQGSKNLLVFDKKNGPV